METFKVDHVITLYDFDKKTEIFSLEIEYNGNINDLDLSNDLLDIGSETEKLPLHKSFYKIVKFESDKYYIDFI